MSSTALEAVVLDLNQHRVACPSGEEVWQVSLMGGASKAVAIREVRGLWVFDRSRGIVPVTQDPDDGGPTWTYRWQCGDGELSFTKPAVDTVPCVLGSPEGCRKRRENRARFKPGDFYVNPRYGQACECCGHQGSHVVRRDGVDLPRCLR